MLLAHFGVPQAGAILVAINTRLSPDEIACIIEHSGACVVFHTPELASLLAKVPGTVRRVDTCGEFEQFLAGGTDERLDSWITDERDCISINYTSGTTGKPKGVMYHYRGAYLNALAMALDHRLTADSVYLWTLPMFHANGWTFPWALAAVGAQSFCFPRFDPGRVWKLFEQGITHFCAAPTVLTMLVNDPAARRLDKPVRVFTAAAPPSPSLLARVVELNFEIEHIYGLTETYGPFTLNVASPKQGNLPPDEQARLKARQVTQMYAPESCAWWMSPCATCRRTDKRWAR